MDWDEARESQMDGVGFAVVAWIEYSPFHEGSLAILER